MENLMDIRRARLENLLQHHSTTDLQKLLGVGEAFLEDVLAGGNSAWTAEAIEKLNWLFFLTATRHVLKWARLNQARTPLSEWEQRVAAALVTKLELVLLTIFKESVPEPGARWDDARMSHEIRQRTDTLDSLEKKYSEGFLDWMRGRNRQAALAQQLEWIQNFAENGDDGLLKFMGYSK